MKDLIQLTTETETTTWIPADSYADLIFEANVCYGQLSGVITCVDHDFGACEGKIIQVRSVPARTAQTLSGIGITDCLSATSSTLTTYSITLSKYGDYDTLPGFSIFQTCGPLKQALLNEMGKGLAKKRDQDILTAMLAFGVPCASSSLASALQCFGNAPKWAVSQTATAIWGRAVDLYDKICYSVGSMRNDSYSPDTLIINPNVAAFLKTNYNQYNIGAPAPGGIVIDENHRLSKCAGLNVIECCNMSACTGLSGATVAMVVDTSRAVGEGWGMRPKYSEVYEPECDYYKEVVMMYWGCNELDRKAIHHIRNP